MSNKIRFLHVLFLLLLQCCFNVYAQTDPIKVQFANNQLTLTNVSQSSLLLNHTKLQFRYAGRISKIMDPAQPDLAIQLDRADALPNRDTSIYTISLNSKQNGALPPQKTKTLLLETDKKDVPHDFKLLAPTPVNVRVTTSNANWVQTISVCNISGQAIPLTDVEFSFNYATTMPTNIWGTPWLAWKVDSQSGGKVILSGGTPWTPPLPSDPNCTKPLTIQFNATPTTPQPTGPFEFKAEGGPVASTGNLTVTLGAAPAAGLANPTLTVSGTGTNQQKVVTWGTAWSLTGLTAGTYTISGTSITSGGQTYTVSPVTTSVTAGATANATLTYTGGSTGTGTVRVTLVNAPTASVPVTLSGSAGTFNQTATNGATWTLPSGSYTVSSTVSGYTASATPNPLVVPTNTALTITYTAIPSGEAGSRTINFVNECPFPVWFGFISGATPSRTGGVCNTDADCHPGNTCVNRGGGGNHCFWKNPVPTNGNFQLAANGGTNSVVIPYVVTPMNAVFSGAAAGRTNCTAAGCETADCGAGTSGCPAGRGFAQPATQIEFTFQTNAPDFYNLSAVNGMNVPAAIGPSNATYNPDAPYNCGHPGNAVAVGRLGACTWEFSPPLVEYNMVRAGGAACTTASDCPTGTRCGLSFNPGQSPLLRKTCGKLIGYWNANQICGVQNTYGAPFNCQETLPAPNGAYKMTNLLGCSPIPSCYQNGATSSCCGCADWDKLGLPVPPAPYTEQCKASNPFWESRVLPGLTWIKRGCPSIYTYPFDDMSSTFVCRVNKENINSTNYTITFCPGGKSAGL